MAEWFKAPVSKTGWGAILTEVQILSPPFMNTVFIYSTYPSKKDAERTSLNLLKKRLIGCGIILGPTISQYHWEGKIVRDTEYVLLAKTLSKHFEKAKKETEKLHPYDIPCIAKIPVEINKKYFEWLTKEVR